MLKYNLSVFIKAVFIITLFSSHLFSQDQGVVQENQTSQIYERIMFIEVRGSQRIEADTIRSYMMLKLIDR